MGRLPGQGRWNTRGLKSTRGEAGPGRPKGAKNKLSVERVEEEIRRIALMDPIAFYAKYGDLAVGKRKDRHRFTLREIHEMDPDARACIASIKVKTENLTTGDYKQDTTVEIKLWSKIEALTLCAKHFGWIDNRATVQVNLDAEIFAELDRWKRQQPKRDAP